MLSLTPTSSGPPYPLTARGGGAASAAGDWLDFSSGLRDIFLHTWHRVRALGLAVSPPFYPRPAPGSSLCATVRAPYVCCALAVPLLLVVLHASAYCGLFPGGRWSRAGPSLLCPHTPCYFPRVGLRLSVPLGCPFFLPRVMRPPLVCPLGHQLAASAQSAPLGPAQRRGSLSGSVHLCPGCSSPSDK